MKTILSLIVMLLLASCARFDLEEAELEEVIFGEPLPNRVASDEHDTHSHAQGHDHVHDHSHGDGDETAVSAKMQVVFVPSQLVTGQNRVAVGLLDGHKQMIHEADVHFHYFDLRNPDAPQLEQEANAYPVQSPDGMTTIFAHERRFDHAGEWGLEVQAQLRDGKTAVQRVRFNVAAETTSVLPGDVAPRLQTPTLADVNGDFSLITSAWEPNPDFYQLSLDEALASGKPTVLLLATPAFCQTRFCGPAYEIATELEEQYGDAATFIHVEVYSGLPNPSESNWELSPVMDAFGLTTEPWVYVIDGNGQVIYRAEGVFTSEEIAAHLSD